MNWAMIVNSAPVELVRGAALVVNDVQYALDIFDTALKNMDGAKDTWSPARLAALNVYPIKDDAVLAGKVTTASTLEFINGAVLRHWTLQDAPPPPVPETISDRQFAQQLAIGGLISQPEALAWVKGGTVPARIQSVVDAITDAAAKFSANMLLSGATSFNRSHPMVGVLGANLGMTPAQIDDIWRAAAAL